VGHRSAKGIGLMIDALRHGLEGAYLDLRSYTRDGSDLIARVEKREIPETGLLKFSHLYYLSVPLAFQVVAIDIRPVHAVPQAVWKGYSFCPVEESFHEHVAIRMLDLVGFVHLIVAEACDYTILSPATANLEEADEGYSFVTHVEGVFHSRMETRVARQGDRTTLFYQFLTMNEQGDWDPAESCEIALSDSQWAEIAARMANSELWRHPRNLGSMAIMDAGHVEVSAKRDGEIKSLALWPGAETPRLHAVHQQLREIVQRQSTMLGLSD
jgi:hypothetical protein